MSWDDLTIEELGDYITALTQAVASKRAAKQASSPGGNVPTACDIKSVPPGATDEQKRCGFGATVRMLIRALICYDLPVQDIQACMADNCTRYDSEWDSCGLSS